MSTHTPDASGNWLPFKDWDQTNSGDGSIDVMPGVPPALGAAASHLRGVLDYRRSDVLPEESEATELSEATEVMAGDVPFDSSPAAPLKRKPQHRASFGERMTTRRERLAAGLGRVATKLHRPNHMENRKASRLQQDDFLNSREVRKAFRSQRRISTENKIMASAFVLALGFLAYSYIEGPVHLPQTSTGEVKMPRNYYVHMKATRPGDDLIKLVRRYGRAHDYPWAAHHAMKATDWILQNAGADEHFKGGYWERIYTGTKPLTVGRRVEVRRDLMQPPPTFDEPTPGLTSP